MIIFAVKLVPRLRLAKSRAAPGCSLAQRLRALAFDSLQSLRMTAAFVVVMLYLLIKTDKHNSGLVNTVGDGFPVPVLSEHEFA